MAVPAKFRIGYAPQVKKELQARCAFCRKHFKQNKLRVGTRLPSGDIQWRHANRKCRAWQYILARIQGPEEFEGWLQIKALDKKKMKRQFVPKTKARILRRETTVPKVPEDPEEEEKQKRGKAKEKVEGEKTEEVKDEDMSDAESDEASSEEENSPKTNGKSGVPAQASVAPKINVSGDDLKARCEKVLDNRMTEIQHVFAKGKDKETLVKAKGIASDIVAMTTVLLQEMD